MAERELSILVRAKGALDAARDIGKVDQSVGRLGKTAKSVGKGVGVAAGAAVAGAAVVIGKSVHSGLESLALLEDAESAVTGAIQTAGIVGQVSAQQISGWANEIETSIEAAFDDKDITNATATLLRFGKVTPSNLRPAMEVMTDLAVKTGSVDSAATLLAKALADPTKAAGKLAKAGVILTKSQQDQIKAYAKAGNAAGAQKVILDALAKSTEGAAKASAGPYRDSLNILADVTEDAQKALATGFLPVITEVRDILSKELAKPQTLENIKKFGQFMSGGLKGLIDTARGLPWDSIGAALQLGGTGAKAVLDAFSKMPPWVQTAVITGWGLNKLSGGALGGIVGELGKGLIKGVLGMNAGVVHLKAGVVTGVGGGGVPPVAAAAGGVGATALAGTALIGVTLVGGAALSLKEILNAANHNNDLAARGLTFDEIRAVKFFNASEAWQQQSLKMGQQMPSRADFDSGMAKLQAATSTAATRVKDDITASAQRQIAATARTYDRIEASRLSNMASDAATRGKLETVRAAALAAGQVAKAGGLAAAAAVAAKDLSVRVNNYSTFQLYARISSRENSSVQTTQKRAYSTLV